MRPLLLLLLVASCARPAVPSPPILSSAGPPETPSLRSGLSVVLRTPSRASYDPAVLGVGRQSVTIRLENRGTQAVRIAPLRATFAAVREGVAFPCRDRAAALVREREPTWLAPAQSVELERTIDCSFALPGTYDVSVFASIGETQELARSFRLEVDAVLGAPAPVPSRDGLFAIMTGNRTTPPMPAEAWGRGDYQVVVAIINGSSHPLPLGPGRFSSLVFRKGSSIPCAGEGKSLALPDELAPGAVHLVQAPIACAPSDEGKYEIVGYLSLGETNESIAIGRLGLRVSSDPKLFTPGPWFIGERTPISGWK